MLNDPLLLIKQSPLLDNNSKNNNSYCPLKIRAGSIFVARLAGYQLASKLKINVVNMT